MIELKTDEPILFFDLREIQKRNGVKQCLEKAEKFHGNPVVRVGKVDACDALQAIWPFSVVYDDQDRLFKMWYSASGHLRESFWNLAHAYSEDGIHWVKPELGLIEYYGNKQNHLVFSSKQGVPHGIFIDPGESDPQKRFKALMTEVLGNGGVCDYGVDVGKAVLTSPDGMDWRKTAGPYLLEEPWPGLIERRPARNRPMFYMDIHQLMFDPYDPNPRHRYKFYGQSMSQKDAGTRPYRNVSIATSPTFGERLTGYEKNPVLDIEREDEIHFPLVHRINGYYIMLHEFAFFEPIDGRYTGDVRISFSRDGFEFERLFPRKALVERGKVGDWDNGWIVVAGELIEKDDKLWIYYAGASERWNNWPQRGPQGFPISTGAVQSGEIGIAWLRADGFTYMACDDDILPGDFTTEAMVLPEQAAFQLAVGAGNTLIRRNWLEVEVLDAATDEAIPGFSKTDAVRCVQDGLRVPVRWNGGKSISGLAGKSVKFHFYLYGNVKLYSFRII